MTLRRRESLALGLLSLALSFGVRAKDGQDCKPEDLAPVDAWLAAHPFRAGPTSAAARVDAACKASPTDEALTIVVTAYGEPHPERPDAKKLLVVALVDKRAGRVRSSFKGLVQEDAVMRLAQGGLSLDTARYQLAPMVRAFGVDVSSDATGPRYASGGLGPWRALFVQDGPVLRLVLDGFILRSWRYIEDGSCGLLNNGDPCDIVTTTATLAIGPHANRGFADLVIAESDDAGGPVKRYVLRYDGAGYGSQAHPTDSIIEEEAQEEAAPVR